MEPAGIQTPAAIINVAQCSRSKDTLKNVLEQILNTVDVRINGSRPWDIQVHNEALYQRIAAEGSLGLGESYMEGWWDCEELDVLFCRLLRAELTGRFKFKSFFLLPIFLSILKAKLLNNQSKSRAFEVGERHYDIGNDLYSAMLDKRMVYTCAYWNGAETLDEAQEAKLDLVCRKLQLKEGMRVLDIGCGWGSFAKYAAEQYGVKVTGVTISREQVDLANKLCEGLPIDIQLKDYRDITGTYDRVVSLGMFEHVGYKNYRSYMETVNRCLKEDGRFLLQTVGSNKSTVSFDPWFNKYIFPNAMIPSVEQIGQSYEGLMIMEDWENLSVCYDKTLMAWYRNFSEHWPLLEPHYGKRFYRMWRYYLLSCAGLFRSRRQQLWQVVFSKHGISQGYERVR